ncbi:MAG: FliM/FliN family flagellar motor switch protein [Phycisphaerales bacterium]
MPGDTARILRLELPVICLLGDRQMTVQEVVALQPGSIIELPKKAEEELTLVVNNRPIATGNAVKVGENFGVKLAYIGDVRARVEAMGKSQGDAQAQEDAAAADLAERLLAGQI